MQVPRLSHLQFLVLGVLLHGDPSGRQVRAELGRYGARRSGPAFYQLMARMEDAELVEGWYEQRVVEGQIFRERKYRITAQGRLSWTASRDFFLSVIGDVGDEAVSRA